MDDRSTSGFQITRLSWIAAELALLAGFYAVCWHGVAHSAPPAAESYLSSDLGGTLSRNDARSFLHAAAAFKDVDRPDGDGMTLLMLAVHQRNAPAVEGLLEMGADVNVACPAYGTPLIRALSSGDVHLAMMLLDRGADANAITRELDTPLVAAARSGKADAVRLILPRVKDPFPDKSLENPLNVAVVEPTESACLELLLGAGIDPNRPGRNGGVPLVTAVASGSPEAVALLLRAGADPSKPNRHGTNAWMAASCRPAMLEVLRRETGRDGGMAS